MLKSRLWTLAMALATSMGRPGSGQALDLEHEIQALVREADPSRESEPEVNPESLRKVKPDKEPGIAELF
ncbi:MAG TPA: hypothetical protein VK465_10765 [Fibrobacteria bacterium]|nr:hypothetical protein [Fibrobacteria bacterium]